MKTLTKYEVKTLLIITFVILEILSMLFNSFFIKVSLGLNEIVINYSIVFFCLAFFIVDIINDFFSSEDAEKMFFYKVYSQTLFMLLSYSAIYVYSLEDTPFSKMIYESPRTIISALVATYVGFKLMNKIMNSIKMRPYQGESVFKRYIYSTLPGEFVFSFIFSFLSFSKDRSFQEVFQIFSSSCLLKIIFSVLFALGISVVFKAKNLNRVIRNTRFGEVKA